MKAERAEHEAEAWLIAYTDFSSVLAGSGFWQFWGSCCTREKGRLSFFARAAQRVSVDTGHFS